MKLGLNLLKLKDLALKILSLNPLMKENNYMKKMMLIMGLFLIQLLD